MHEIEAKIHLTKKEFDCLKEDLNGRKKVIYKGFFKKEDVYYQIPIPNVTIRIRKLNKKSHLNIKYKSIQKGIEMNKEWEWELKRPLFFKNLLKKTGLQIYATKKKQTDLFTWKKMNIELNWVKHLGYFLEIEALVKDQKKIHSTTKELKKMFELLGFKKRKFEKKPYLELLAKN